MLTIVAATDHNLVELPADLLLVLGEVPDLGEGQALTAIRLRSHQKVIGVAEA